MNDKIDLDLNLLRSRIEKIRSEGKETSEFTKEFIECLITRHSLEDCIPENFSIEDVPDTIIQTIISGEIPTIQEIELMNDLEQNYLIIELIWICGLATIATYSKQNQDLLDEFGLDFQSILSMMDVSEAHYIGSYIICALTLLMGKIPSLETLEMITRDFDPDPNIINKCKEFFYELCSGIISRYREDLEYYDYLTRNDSK